MIHETQIINQSRVYGGTSQCGRPNVFPRNSSTTWEGLELLSCWDKKCEDQPPVLSELYRNTSNAVHSLCRNKDTMHSSVRTAPTSRPSRSACSPSRTPTVPECFRFQIKGGKPLGDNNIQIPSRWSLAHKYPSRSPCSGGKSTSCFMSSSNPQVLLIMQVVSHRGQRWTPLQNICYGQT